MEIRDPIHGSIDILDEEIPIIRNNFFQRLRGIKQLGFSEFVFPGATHTRFLHSLGVMDIGRRAFNKLFANDLGNHEIMRMKETFKLACLLHDIGHAPLSHSTESVMPNVSSLDISTRFVAREEADRQATHEDYTIKAITDSSLADSLKKVEKKFGVCREAIAELIIGSTTDSDYFTVKGINYFPLLHQLISSELDCDRMDYLLKDSYFCGVSYGNYDLDWLLDNLDTCIIDGSAHLGISERAVVTFDDFLLSRFHMFLMVYFHYRSVCLEQLLQKYFKTSPEEYKIPSDINKYLEHDDQHLMKALKASQNPYAKAIINNQIPTKIFESFNNDQLSILEATQGYLELENIEYIRSSSTGRLSKYYNKDSKADKYAIKVCRTVDGKDSKVFFNIDQATDLFDKFAGAHAVNRLHCNIEHLSNKHQKKIKELIRS